MDLPRLDGPTPDSASPDVPGSDVGPEDLPPPDASPTVDAIADIPPGDVPPLDAALPDVSLPDVSPPVDVPPTSTPARLIAPITGSHVGPRPTLRWSLATGTTGAHVTLCRDRAMSVGCVSFDALGTQGAPTVALSRGIWFWATGTSASRSAVWRLVVGTANLPRAWGGDPDVNGDGFADLIGHSYQSVCVFLGDRAGIRLAATCFPQPFTSTGFGDGGDSAGDLDGDGYTDVVIGAPASDNVYVYRGSATGLLPTYAQIDGPRGSRFGRDVNGVGDLDGDGYADVTVHPFAFFGSATGLGRPVRMTTEPYRAAGDVNADGYSDLYTFNQVLLGGPTGVDPAGLRSIFVGRTPLSSVGTVPAGDIDGDGAADLAALPALPVSSSLERFIQYGATAYPGRVEVLTGLPDISTSPFDRGEFSRLPGDYNGDGFTDLLLRSDHLLFLPGSATGVTVGSVGVPGFGGAPVIYPLGGGDLDGDGFDDLVSGGSILTVTPGSSTGIPIAPGLIVINVPVDGAPAGVSAIGDVDRDGRADAVIADVLYRGSATGFAAPMALPAFPPAFATRMGSSASWAGDVDGDGYGDFTQAIIAHPFSRLGRVCFGALGGVRAACTVITSGYVGPSGTAPDLGGAGDVNHDGLNDIVHATSNRAALLWGARTAAGLGATSIFGDLLSAGSAHLAAAAGDVNGDGFADVVVQQTEMASFAVYPGSATGVSNTPIRRATPSVGYVVPVGDVDHDGYDDLMAQGEIGLLLYRGSASAPGPAPVSTGLLGRVRPVGDINRDGYADIVTSASETQIFLGGPSGFVPTHFLYLGLETSPATARGPLGFGDFDGDGTNDVLLVGRGRAYLQRMGAVRATSRELGRFVTPTGSSYAVYVYR